MNSEPQKRVSVHDEHYHHTHHNLHQRASSLSAIITATHTSLLPVKISMMIAVIISALVLFVVGAYKAHSTVGNPEKSGLEIAIIGIISALVGYAVGAILKVPASP